MNNFVESSLLPYVPYVPLGDNNIINISDAMQLM